MKLCIFLKMHMVLSLDNFNITYNLKQRAQARLGRSAPCLGLIVYFNSNVQYRLISIETLYTMIESKFLLFGLTL